MLHAAEPAKVEVPAVLAHIKPQLLDALGQQVIALLALAAADDLADARHEQVGRRHRLAVVVQAHVEGLDVLRIVGHKHGLFVHLLGQIALVLGLQVDAPRHRVFELRVRLLEDLHGLGVGDARKIVADNVLEPLEQALVDKLVEELHLRRAALEHRVDEVLDHGLGRVEIAGQVAERHLRLDHPELRRMPRGEAALGAERRAECVDVAERQRERLAVELAAHGQVHRLFKEILAVVDRAVRRFRRVADGQRGHLEHLARALAVGAGQQRRVHIHKAALLEELVDRRREHGADAERRLKHVRPGPEVLDRAQILERVALLLQRVVRRARPLDHDAVRMDFKRLRRIRRQAKLAADGNRAAGGQIPAEVSFIVGVDDLHRLEHRAVRQLDKAECLPLAHGAHPAAHLNHARILLGRLLQLP